MRDDEIQEMCRKAAEAEGLRWAALTEAERAAEAEGHKRRERAEFEGPRRRALLDSQMARRLPDAVVDRVVADSLDANAYLAAARDWLVSRSNPMLFLGGPVGRGKTVTAAWVVAQVQCQTVVVTSHHVLRVFAGLWGESLRAQEQIIRAGLLVVDDVGREKPEQSEDMQAALLELVDQRQSQVRTVITTNLRTAEFKARYPDTRLASRLAALAHTAYDSGDDMRRNA